MNELIHSWQRALAWKPSTRSKSKISSLTTSMIWAVASRWASVLTSEMICLKKSFAWREIVKIITVKKLQRKNSNLTWNPAIILFLSSDKASHSWCHSSYRSFRPRIQHWDGHSLVWQHSNWLSAHGLVPVNAWLLWTLWSCGQGKTWFVRHWEHFDTRNKTLVICLSLELLSNVSK